MGPKSRRSYSVDYKQRLFLLHTDKDSPKSLGEIAKAEGLARSTVQSIINSYRKVVAGTPKKKMGRPSKLPKTYVLCSFSKDFTRHPLFRWVKRLVILAKRNPFWGGKRLALDIYNNMMAMHASMPPGHQFQVHNTPISIVLYFFCPPDPSKAQCQNGSEGFGRSGVSVTQKPEEAPLEPGEQAQEAPVCSQACQH